MLNNPIANNLAQSNTTNVPENDSLVKDELLNQQVPVFKEPIESQIIEENELELGR